MNWFNGKLISLADGIVVLFSVIIYTCCVRDRQNKGNIHPDVKYFVCYGRCWLLEDGGHLPRKKLAITYK